MSKMKTLEEILKEFDDRSYLLSYESVMSSREFREWCKSFLRSSLIEMLESIVPEEDKRGELPIWTDSTKDVGVAYELGRMDAHNECRSLLLKKIEEIKGG